MNKQQTISPQQLPADHQALVIPLPAVKKELSKDEKQLVTFIAKLLVQKTETNTP
jgi:hypothetical protein